MSGEQSIVIKSNSSKYVKLNVGGSLFYTTLDTLTKHDNMLRAMFSGRMEVLTDSEGYSIYVYVELVTIRQVFVVKISIDIGTLTQTRAFLLTQSINWKDFKSFHSIMVENMNR